MPLVALPETFKAVIESGLDLDEVSFGAFFANPLALRYETREVNINLGKKDLNRGWSHYKNDFYYGDIKRIVSKLSKSYTMLCDHHTSQTFPYFLFPSAHHFWFHTSDQYKPLKKFVSKIYGTPPTTVFQKDLMIDAVDVDLALIVEGYRGKNPEFHTNIDLNLLAYLDRIILP
jgi:hypothetical protein